MPDPLGAFVFVISTAFALTVDVGLYAMAIFATAPRPRDALRFAFEVGIAHAALLAAGALTAEAMLRALGSDLAVDIAAGVALLVVLRGAFLRARVGSGAAREPDADDRSAKPTASSFSWLTAIALSIDAFLVGPAAREYALAYAVGEKLVFLAAVGVAVTAFAYGYASVARSWNARYLARVDGGLAFAVASAAEIIVFAVFFADAVFRALAHARIVLGVGAARGIGALLGVALFVLARRGVSGIREENAR